MIGRQHIVTQEVKTLMNLAYSPVLHTPLMTQRANTIRRYTRLYIADRMHLDRWLIEEAVISEDYMRLRFDV